MVDGKVKNNVERKMIAECAEVIPGVLDQKNPDGEILLYDAVMPGQIAPNGFLREYGKIRRVAADAMPFLEVGDVIIKRLNPDCAAVFEDITVKALPSANLFVMRPHPGKLDPYYLAFILENSNILPRISQRSGIGSTVSAVTANKLKCSEIPLPPLKEQCKLGALWQCMKKRNKLAVELIAENGRLLRSIGDRYFNYSNM